MSTEIEALESALAEVDDPAERTEQLLRLADLCQVADPQRGVEYALEARRLARRRRDEVGVARSHHMEGVCVFRLGRHAAAREELEKADAMLEKLGEVKHRAVVLFSLAVAMDYSGDLPATLDVARRLEAICDPTIHSPDLLLRVDNVFGVIYKRVGSYTRAIERFTIALETTRRIGNRDLEAMVLNNIGTAYQDLGNDELAIEYMERSLVIAIEQESIAQELHARTNIGRQRRMNGATDEALEHLERARAIAIELRDTRTESTILGQLALIEQARGDFDEALATMRQSIALAEQAGDRVYYLHAQLIVAQTLLKKGSYDEALETVHAVRSIARELGSRASEAECEELLADICEAAGRATEALEHYRAASRIEAEIRGSREQAKAAEAAMRARIEEAELERERARRQKEEIEAEMKRKQSELSAMALAIVEKSQTITSLRRQIAQISEDADASARPKLRALLRSAEQSEERRADWKRFEAQFDETHRDFSRSLIARCPELSRAELKVCALLKIGMATKEIAEILATSPRTIDGHRRNIRRKLGLSPDANLTVELGG